MPFNIKSQVVTALDNINKNPELYTPPKSIIPLETRINNLKETNSTKYKEYLSKLTTSANNGNKKAKELLGKIGEDASRKRRGYEGLNTAMYIPSLSAAASIVTPTLSTTGRGVSWLYHQIPPVLRRGIDVGLTIDGVRNVFSNNGWQKTKKEWNSNNYGRAILSGTSDVLDLVGGAGLLRRGYNVTKAVPELVDALKNISDKSVYLNRFTHPIITSKFNSAYKKVYNFLPEDLRNELQKNLRTHTFHNSDGTLSGIFKNIGPSYNGYERKYMGLGAKNTTPWTFGHEIGHNIYDIIDKKPELRYTNIIDAPNTYTYSGSPEIDSFIDNDGEFFADLVATRSKLDFKREPSVIQNRIRLAKDYNSSSFLQKGTMPERAKQKLWAKQFLQNLENSIHQNESAADRILKDLDL